MKCTGGIVWKWVTLTIHAKFHSVWFNAEFQQRIWSRRQLSIDMTQVNQVVRSSFYFAQVYHYFAVTALPSSMQKFVRREWHEYYGWHHQGLSTSFTQSMGTYKWYGTSSQITFYPVIFRGECFQCNQVEHLAELFWSNITWGWVHWRRWSFRCTLSNNVWFQI